MNISKKFLFFISLVVVFGVCLIFLNRKTNSRLEHSSLNLKEYQLANLYGNLKTVCSDNSLVCFEEQFNKLVKDYGPKPVLDILEKLYDEEKISKSTDDHQIAHRVGRETAEALGINGPAFLSCPTSFNNGCQHGFFEYALGKTKNTKETIDSICGSLGPEYSSKFKFYCYHGVGHGIMMAQAYNLDKSLEICDLLDPLAADGCWQGVFMENVSASMRGEAREGIFSKTDPLAPCNKVEEKYRHECFINHAGWLMTLFPGNVKKASSACQKAPSISNTNSCLQSLGLMVTNPVWQLTLSRNLNLEGKSSEEKAWSICLEFPKSYREQCIWGGVDNILNFDELEIKRAESFCNLVKDNYKNNCYQRIGLDIKSQVVQNDIVIQKCSNFNSHLKKECLKGAGMQ